MKIYEFSKKYVEEYEKDRSSAVCKMWEAALKSSVIDEFTKKLSPELQSKIITEVMKREEKEVQRHSLAEYFLHEL